MKLGVRPAVVAALAVVASVTAATPGRSASRVVGGTPILVQSAPWAVYVKLSMGSTGMFCSGTIIDDRHVVTAAHCVYTPDGMPAAASALRVRAGISSSTRPLRSDAEQDRDVESVRIHPGYGGPSAGSPDDVAVLTLAAPLDLSGPAAQAAALPGPGAVFPAADTELGFAGFGRENPAVPATGTLNWLAARIDEQGTCGDFSSAVVRDANAVSFCTYAPSSAVCGGDSGSGLVTGGPQRILVGVVSAGQLGCGAGSRTILTAVWPQEVLQFIQGNDAPPVAPRQTASTYARLFWDPPLVPGKSILCFSDRWDGNPSLTYTFVNSGERVLQQGPAGAYRLGSGSAGDVVSCRVSATNAGGTAVLGTDWVGAVPEPRTTASLRSRSARSRSGAVRR